MERVIEPRGRLLGGDAIYLRANREGHRDGRRYDKRERGRAAHAFRVGKFMAARCKDAPAFLGYSITKYTCNVSIRILNNGADNLTSVTNRKPCKQQRNYVDICRRKWPSRGPSPSRGSSHVPFGKLQLSCTGRSSRVRYVSIRRCDFYSRDIDSRSAR